MKKVYAIYNSQGVVYSVVDLEELTDKILFELAYERILELFKALREAKL